MELSKYGKSVPGLRDQFEDRVRHRKIENCSDRWMTTHPIETRELCCKAVKEWRDKQELRTEYEESEFLMKRRPPALTGEELREYQRLYSQQYYATNKNKVLAKKREKYKIDKEWENL